MKRRPLFRWTLILGLVLGTMAAAASGSSAGTRGGPTQTAGLGSEVMKR